MSTFVLTLIAAGTLAFGAVYPWAYLPLLAAAVVIGVMGLRRGGTSPALHHVAVSLLVLWAVAALQLIPLPPALVGTVSPSAPAIAGSYSLTFAGDASWLPLSIDPARTRVAVAAIGALGLYVIGLPALLTARGLRHFPCGLACVAMPLALFVIYTREHNNGLIYGFWQSLDGGGADQAGPFINRNHFGGWIVMSLCVMVGWLLGRIERAVPAGKAPARTSIVSDDMGAVLLMGTVIVLGTISLFWVVSRSAIVSFGAATVVFAWLAIERRTMGSTQRTLVLAMLAVALLAGVSWRGLDTLVRWFLDERSLLSRIDAWRDGWDVVRDFPLFGTGLNTYSPAMLFYQTRNPEFHMAQAHNDYLQLLAEGGAMVAIAAAVTAGLLVRAIRQTLRAARIEAHGYWIRAGAAVGLMAVACQELVEFSLQIPANAFLFCTLAAIAITPVSAAHTRATVTSRGNIQLAKESAGAALP
ncbi:MAG: O-antigen ligase family protein [Vicinamibacterales bacterium]